MTLMTSWGSCFNRACPRIGVSSGTIFLAESATYGFFVNPKSVVELEDWIEAWAWFCGLLPRDDLFDRLGEIIARQSAAVDRPLMVGNQATGNRGSEEQIALLSYPANSQPSQKEPKPLAAGAPKRDKPSPLAKVAEPSDVPPAVITKTQLPAAHRGVWVQGTPGEGAFRFNDLPENQKVGMAGKEVRFANQHIAVGGFPAEKYFGGSAATATVEIKSVLGNKADGRAADIAMREKMRKPNWQRPDDYIWNHAGSPGSKTMELVAAKAHRATSHKGPAAPIRALQRLATGRAMGILNVYLVARDVLQTTGILQPDYSVTEQETYHFVAEDGSVFVVWPAGWVSSARREFISGPRHGQKEGMTNAEVNVCRKKAEEVWGKYIRN